MLANASRPVAEKTPVEHPRLVLRFETEARIEFLAEPLVAPRPDRRQKTRGCGKSSPRGCDVAIRHAKRLIDARQYVLRSRWQDVQPRAREQNAYLKTHSWDEYAAWHLGLTEGAPDGAYRLPLPRSRVAA